MQLWSLFSNKSTFSSNLKNLYLFIFNLAHMYFSRVMFPMCVFLTHSESQFHNHLISSTFPPIIAYHSSIVIYCSIYTEDDCIHIPSTSYSISSQIYTLGKPNNMNSSTVTPNSSSWDSMGWIWHCVWPTVGTRVKNLYHIHLLSDSVQRTEAQLHARHTIPDMKLLKSSYCDPEIKIDRFEWMSLIVSLHIFPKKGGKKPCSFS